MSCNIFFLRVIQIVIIVVAVIGGIFILVALLICLCISYKCYTSRGKIPMVSGYNISRLMRSFLCVRMCVCVCACVGGY